MAEEAPPRDPLAGEVSPAEHRVLAQLIRNGCVDPAQVRRARGLAGSVGAPHRPLPSAARRTAPRASGPKPSPHER